VKKSQPVSEDLKQSSPPQDGKKSCLRRGAWFEGIH
jgi:hypothetical protein